VDDWNGKIETSKKYAHRIFSLYNTAYIIYFIFFFSSSLIYPCWLLDANLRPKFKKLLKVINSLMKGLAAMEYLEGQEQIVSNL
jgi:hypothetical protein